MRDDKFVLICENCGQVIKLENNMEIASIDKKFNIVVNDEKEILIICKKCNKRIKI